MMLREIKIIKKIAVFVIVLSGLASLESQARWGEPMVRCPGGENRSRLPERVDQDYTSALNTQNPNRLEADIADEVPSYYRGKVTPGVLR